jgi:hypothetical protein
VVPFQVNESHALMLVFDVIAVGCVTVMDVVAVAPALSVTV